MKRNLLISGDRANFTTLAFDPDKKALSILADYAAPYNASWVEPVSSYGSIDHLVGLSEGLPSGLLYSFQVDHAQKLCKITSQQPTLGEPCHFITLRDGSSLALGTYSGGSIALYAISTTNTDGVLLLDRPRAELIPTFAYELVGHGPNESRQQQCHIHQILEDRRGLLYALDLGADRVWILVRDKMKLEVRGWLQCPPGSGPRHAVLNPDETIMYVLAELSNTVIAFEVPASPAEAIQPIDGFQPNIIPPSVHPEHHFMKACSEICSHPTIPNVLYVSNRWDGLMAQREPHLRSILKEYPAGEYITVILLSSDGRDVESIKHVRCNVDVIRGMRLTRDGKYIAVLGQEAGGVEIYSIGGEKGNAWRLVASLNEGLEAGIKHAVWL